MSHANHVKQFVKEYENGDKIKKIALEIVSSFTAKQCSNGPQSSSYFYARTKVEIADRICWMGNTDLDKLIEVLESPEFGFIVDRKRPVSVAIK